MPPSDKVTIKVKILEEEYHEITIDWSDGQTALQRQQSVFRKLQSITGIPIEYSYFLIFAIPEERVGWSVFYNSDFKLKSHGTLTDDDRFNKEKVMSIIENGDEFIICSDLRCSDDKHLYCFYTLIHTDFLDETDCSEAICHHKESRAFTNRRAQLVADEALNGQLNCLLPNNRSGNEREWVNIYLRLNIYQFIVAVCKQHEPFRQENSGFMLEQGDSRARG
ncbi:uncharacterized protein LOC107363565 [Tetranychus urticae]|uniref:Uncharacterized protein n=1 Tax=Tetranychus urticae TaxID=32264 RepID=T1KG30_TETUR|nr:uncharacterized protein LOC107363565 [Tetranychus urticae]